MARKVGFGGRRSVLGRRTVEERAEEYGFEPPATGGATGRAAIFLGFALLYGIPLLFAAIGAYPALNALGFPDRAHEVQAEVIGRQSVQPSGEPERVTSIAIAYETRIGARLTADVAMDRNIEIGETIVVFYDPEAPRTVRLSRDVSLDEALNAGGDRIFFAYFALGFMALVTVMVIAVFRGRRKKS